MNELKRKYEAMIIVDAKLPTPEKESIFKESTDAVSKGGGQVINNQVWLEKHRMSFPIKKCQEGTYYLINFEGVGEVNTKIRQTLKLNEKILRFAITHVA